MLFKGRSRVVCRRCRISITYTCLSQSHENPFNLRTCLKLLSSSPGFQKSKKLEADCIPESGALLVGYVGPEAEKKGAAKIRLHGNYDPTEYSVRLVQLATFICQLESSFNHDHYPNGLIHGVRTHSTPTFPSRRRTADIAMPTSRVVSVIASTIIALACGTNVGCSMAF